MFLSQKSTNLVSSLPSGLCSNATLSEKLSLTILSKRLLLLFIFYAINLLHIFDIYLFVSCLQTFIMVVWIIFFNSAQAVTMWLCKASYYSDMYFSALLDIACGMLWLVGCKQRWPWQSWVEDLKDFYSPFFYFCHPPWEENASGRWFVPEWWRHVMGNWTWPEASPSQTLANQVKISQTSSDLQTCTWKE